MGAAGALLLAFAIAFGVAIVANSPARAADESVSWALPTGSSVTIQAGDTVTWTWGDGFPHTVSSVTGPGTFDSGNVTGMGSTFAFTFNTPGTYTYRCNIHPSDMMGTVVVQGAATTPAATPTLMPTATASPGPATTAIPGARSFALSGAQEVPPITTSATGSFEWKLDGSTLLFRLQATGSAMTQAHIHLGASGANGPVVAFLFGPHQDGVGSIDAAGSIGAAQLVGPLAGKLADFLAALDRGELYVNVHSKDHPAGLLRGQVTAPSPGSPKAGTGIAEPAGGGVGNRAAGALALLALAGVGGGAWVARRWRARSGR